jgi:ABC-type Mn2+/Zn2+ transport system permease subunit
MIADFVDSWGLFHDAYASALLVSALLGTVGVLVVARDQIFIGAAISQASMLGIAMGIRAEEIFLQFAVVERFGKALHAILGGVVAILGALLTSLGGGGRESREAITGWVFLLGASGSVIAVAHSPHGLAEVEHLLASTLLGAGPMDVATLSLLLLATVVATIAYRDEILLTVVDPEMAQACGVATSTIDRALAVWLGIVVATSIHVAGVLFAFGSLVLPALTAKNLCREIRQMLVAAPLLSVLATLAALIAANAYDYPPGQMAVAFDALMLLLAWGYRAGRR